MTGTTLNVAATRVGTEALGPGVRSALWVQGCPFRCAGCMATDWIPFQPARRAGPRELAEELLADPGVGGLTFSGGEPMAQAAGLAEVARLAREMRDVSVICFTGYRLERLRTRPPSPGVAELLGRIDVLIDGPYVAALDDGRGLRGSSNQRVHHLTGRHADGDYDFADRPRTAEIAVTGPEALLIGVPPKGLLAAFDSAVDTVRARVDAPVSPISEAVRTATGEQEHDER
ncbi:radical SAM protein [Streptomyces sp. NBC_00984]|uniref:4Fe-4S single cluster domain-containing protein n=1 Tax=Streptomyces sp. NBC_00984 TaxID=2903700 RepID=UPI00386378D6|nr:radical SAM protein [Streptomyces sp. NBC_00984]